MPYLDVREGRVFYERHGRGEPPLVFVHGIACSHDDWQPQVDALADRHTVVACDLRAHGRSAGDPADCSIETFGADVVALLEELDLPPAVLIGHSMGCRVVLEAHLRAARRVAALILVDGSRSSVGSREGAEEAARRMLESSGYAAVLRGLFEAMFLEGSEPGLKERIIDRALALPEEVGCALLPRFLGWDAGAMDDAFARVAVPLLVLQSTYLNTERVRIPLAPGASTPWFDLVRQHVPAAQIEIVSGPGHFPMLEAPDAVNEIIAAFTASLAHR